MYEWDNIEYEFIAAIIKIICRYIFETNDCPMRHDGKFLNIFVGRIGFRSETIIYDRIVVQKDRRPKTTLLANTRVSYTKIDKRSR